MNPHSWQPLRGPECQSLRAPGSQPRSLQHPDLMPLTTVLSVCEQPRPEAPPPHPVPEAHSGSSVGTDRMPSPSSFAGSGGIGFSLRHKVRASWPLAVMPDSGKPSEASLQGEVGPKAALPWVDSAERLAMGTVGGHWKVEAGPPQEGLAGQVEVPASCGRSQQATAALINEGKMCPDN